MNKKIKKVAVAYARYSSNNQREESIDAQLRAIREYCEKNDIELIEVYVDEAVSGTTAARDNFQQMINDILTGVYTVDIVLVHKFNRFARSKFDSAIYKKKLKDEGIRVVSVTQIIDETPEGEMLESFLEAIDQYYSANLSLEIYKGIKENAINCKWNGGRIPLGLSLNNDGLFEPNEQAHIVKRIFTEYAAGVTLYNICQQLNAEGVVNQFGKPFAIRTVGYMLQNEKYIGNYVYTVNGEVIRHDGKITPIIDRDLWNKVQKTIKERSKPRLRSTEIHLLTGKMFCDECGYIYTGGGNQKSPTTGKITRYYRCKGKHPYKVCKGSRPIQKNWIENSVLNTIIETVLNEEKIRIISQMAFEQLAVENQEPKISLAALQKELKEIHAEEKNLARLYLKNKISVEILDEESEILSNRKYHLESEIKIRKAAQESDAFSYENIFNFFMNFIEELQTGTAENADNFKRAVFDAFLEKVIISENAVTVQVKVNFPNLTKGRDKAQNGGAFSHLSLFAESVKFRRPAKYSKEEFYLNK